MCHNQHKNKWLNANGAAPAEAAAAAPEAAAAPAQE